jgi:hypothetical protein
MASKYQMQAASSVNGRLYSWLAVIPDWQALGFPGPGIASDVSLIGGGLGTSGSLTDGFVVNNAGEQLVNASGAQLIVQQTYLVNANGFDLVNAGGADLLVGR